MRKEDAQVGVCSKCQKTAKLVPGKWTNICYDCSAAYFREYRKTWSPRNRERIAGYNQLLRSRYSLMKYYAKRRKIPFSLSFEEFAELRTGPCAYCGSPLDAFGHGIDRMDSAKGYESGNVVACCGVCNSVKGALLTYEDMLEVGKIVARRKALNGHQ